MTTRPHSVTELDFQPAQALHPSPVDWRDQVIYFLLVDRFDDNQEHPPYTIHSVGNGRDPAEGRRFQGGNIKGITRRLDYLQELGCTTVWLSPIFKNRLDKDDSYHGYGVQDFLDIDPRFGTNELYQQFVNEAHKRGLKVIFDHVSNHIGIRHPWIKNLPTEDWLNGSEQDHLRNKQLQDWEAKAITCGILPIN